MSPSLFSGMQAQTTNMVIGIDELQCESGAKSLADCSHSPWGSHNCDHSKDVALICGTSRKFSQPRQNIASRLYSLVWNNNFQLLNVTSLVMISLLPTRI